MIAVAEHSSATQRKTEWVTVAGLTDRTTPITREGRALPTPRHEAIMMRNAEGENTIRQDSNSGRPDRIMQ